MEKRALYGHNLNGRRDTFFVREDRQYLRKHAANYHPLVAQYIERAKPIPNLVQVLLTALGDYERWGVNKNGDAFPEKALAHEGDDYGYQTFKSSANYFLHHNNKDPALAKGKVLHAVWNERMKRVELVVGIDINLDPEAVTAIDRGEDLCFSMGARLPYDVCSICANRAKNRAEYCDHLRYQMNEIDPHSGRQVYAINTLPKFFDISRVLIPADKTAHMWTKVANAGGLTAASMPAALLAEIPADKYMDAPYLQQKLAEFRDIRKVAVVGKRAAIVKRINADEPAKPLPPYAQTLERIIPVASAALDAHAPEISRSDLASIFAQEPKLNRVLSTLHFSGIPLRDRELLHMCEHAGQHSARGIMIDPDLINADLARALMPLIAARSVAKPVLVRRIVLLANKLDGEPKKALEKKASEVRALLKQDTKTVPVVNPGAAAGLLAGLYILARAASGKPLARTPAIMGTIISASIGAGIAQAMGHTSIPVSSGVYSVDDPTRGFYNRDWQSRFARMQAQPVTVIKTAGSTFKHKQTRDLGDKIFLGLPALFLAHKYNKAREERGDAMGPVGKSLSRAPEIYALGALAEHSMGSPVSGKVMDAVRSVARFKKNASLRDVEFLSLIPEPERDAVWDIAILDAALRIENKLSKGV